MVVAATTCLLPLARDGSGSAAVYTALMMPVLLGALGLGVDVSLWYAGKRSAQSVADASALAGALELARAGSADAVSAAAEEDAALNGYDPDAGDTLTINFPPASGPSAGRTTAVEAVARLTTPAPFSRLFLDRPLVVAARAVAEVAPPDNCLWLLEPEDTALELVGSADAEFGCGVHANSTSAAAIDLEGKACLTATSVAVAGGASGGCIAPEPRTDAVRLGDPLAHVQAPGHAGCTHTGRVEVKSGAPATLSPGVYCGGIDISGDADVEFEPGTYVIAGDVFKATGNSTLTGSGVTFYLTEGTGGFAELQLNATATSLSAPTSGEFRGVLFFGDRNAPESLAHRIAGNADLELDGTLYFPTAQLQFAGGGSLDGASTVIVARKVRLVGNTRIGLQGGVDGLAPGIATADLVE